MIVSHSTFAGTRSPRSTLAVSLLALMCAVLAVGGACASSLLENQFSSIEEVGLSRLLENTDALGAGADVDDAVFMAQLEAAVTAAKASTGTCAWAVRVKEGTTTITNLEPQWDSSACAGNYLSVKAVMYPSGFSVPNVHVAQVRYSPPVTGAKSVYYSRAELSIKCNLFTPLCDTATVYYIVDPYTTSPPTTTTTTTTTAPPQPTTTPTPTGDNTTSPAPTTLQPTTAPPQPNTTQGPVSCPEQTSMEAVVGVPTPFDFFSQIGGCTSNPSIVILNTSTAAASLFSVGVDGKTLWFDAKGVNTNTGLFYSYIGIRCGASQLVYCEIEHIVAATGPLTPSPTVTPSACHGKYGFQVYFNQVNNLKISPHAEDLALCPVVNSTTGAKYTSNKTAFELYTLPKYNPTRFSLNSTTGAFSYLAPNGPPTKVDSFTFILNCNNANVCLGQANLISMATPQPTENPDSGSGSGADTCPGDFSFVYYLNADGSFSASPRNLFTAANNTGVAAAPYCGAVSGISEMQRLSAPSNGSLSIFNGTTGEFYYIPYTPYATYDWDSFTVSLICKTNSSVVPSGHSNCTATVKVLVTTNTTTSTASPDSSDSSGEDENTVYHLGSITCTGTCDSNAWKSAEGQDNYYDTTTRPDGKAADGVEFSFNAAGNLEFTVYSTIGSMSARFPTFSPVWNKSYPNVEPEIKDITAGLVSGSILSSSHNGFNTTCLDQQASIGSAYSIWTWTDASSTEGHLNYAEKQWAAGSNYYQKFGGKHVKCDTFRKNPCKYAPLYTPSTSDQVKWTVDIKDCYAIWRGSVSLKDIATMKLPDGTPVFTRPAGLQSDDSTSNILTGTLYAQSITPASWTTPASGIRTTATAYTVTFSTRTLVVTSLTVSPVTSNVSAATAETASTSKYTFTSDASYAVWKDASTNERLVNYSLRLYPISSATQATTAFIPTTATSSAAVTSHASTILRVAAVKLLSSSWVMPSQDSCPSCGGTQQTCQNLTSGLSWTSGCMKSSIVSLFPRNSTTVRFSLDGSSVLTTGGSGSSTEGSAYFQVDLLAYVAGADSANVVGQLEGEYVLQVTFSNGQVISTTVAPSAYISEVGNGNAVAGVVISRSTPYAPVADPYKASIPVAPYTFTADDVTSQAVAPAAGTSSSPADQVDPTTAYYAAPLSLSSSASANALDAAAVTSQKVSLGSLNLVSVPSNSQTSQTVSTKSASMQSVSNAEQYSGNDWALLSVNTLLSSSSVSVDSVALVVPSNEVYGTGASMSNHKHYTVFVLQGNTTAVQSAMSQWTATESYSPYATTVPMYEVLDWPTYASGLNVRRISVGTSNAKQYIAFVPGAALHNDSSTLVSMSVLTTVTSPSLSASSATMYYEAARIIVNKQLTSTVRQETNSVEPAVVYSLITPSETTTKKPMSGGAIAGLVILCLVTTLTIIAGVYFEYKHKKIIDQCDEVLKKVGDSAPVEVASSSALKKTGDSAARKAPGASGASAPQGSASKRFGGAGAPSTGSAPVDMSKVKGLKTEFGIVREEPLRVKELDEHNVEVEPIPRKDSEMADF